MEQYALEERTHSKERMVQGIEIGRKGVFKKERGSKQTRRKGRGKRSKGSNREDGGKKEREKEVGMIDMVGKEVKKLSRGEVKWCELKISISTCSYS